MIIRNKYKCWSPKNYKKEYVGEILNDAFANQ